MRARKGMSVETRLIAGAGELHAESLPGGSYRVQGKTYRDVVQFL
jgi:hypothetical protein